MRFQYRHSFSDSFRSEFQLTFIRDWEYGKDPCLSSAKGSEKDLILKILNPKSYPVYLVSIFSSCVAAKKSS